MRSVALAAAFGLSSSLACTKFAALGDTPQSDVDTSGAVAQVTPPARVDPTPPIAPTRGSEGGSEGSADNLPLSPAVGVDTNEGSTDGGLIPEGVSSEPPADAGTPAPPPPLPVPDVPSDPPGTVRFVRLVADSEVLARPVAAVGELDLLGPDGASLDHSLWIASADSAEPTYVGGAPAQQAIDGDIESLWHTAWFELDDPPGYPHELQISLGRPERVAAFRYVPRQSLSVGRIATYRFFVSRDGLDWGNPVAAGVFPNSASEQTVSIAPE